MPLAFKAMVTGVGGAWWEMQVGEPSGQRALQVIVGVAAWRAVETSEDGDLISYSKDFPNIQLRFQISSNLKIQNTFLVKSKLFQCWHSFR
jgi:hypothetical protein